MGTRRLALSRRVRGIRRTGIRSVRRRIVPVPPNRGWWRTWLIAGLTAGGFAGALFLGYRLWPSPAVTATVPLKHGTVEQSVLTNALVVRREQVVTAPIAGGVSQLVAEGERVRVGTPVVRIGPGGASAAAAAAGAAVPGTEPGGLAAAERDALAETVRQLDARLYQLAVSRSQAKAKGDAAEATRLQAELDATAARQTDVVRQLNGGAVSPAPGATAPPGGALAATVPMRDGTVTAETAGVLIYHVDGLEEALSPSGADAWRPSWFRTLAVPLLRNTGAGQVAAGAPLFKIVDNISPGLVLVVPADIVAGLPAGSWVQIRLTGRDGLLPAKITGMVPEGSDVLLHLSAPAFPEELIGRRKLQLSLVLADYTGKVVPRSAVDVRDGLQGVWIWDGKQPEFRPAPVIGGNEQEVVLETDLPDATRILRTAPRAMR
ncbi:MAG: hypothetical protein JWN15_1156 [Firmicutes bacterium]|nr:hypothetical protein [Bacillota bacterium]